MKKNFLLKDNYTGLVDKKHKTSVVVELNDKFMNFWFKCENSKCLSGSDKYNGPLYEGDVCEAFICTDGSDKHYYEVEVAPNGCVYLSVVDFICYHEGPTHDDDADDHLIEKNFIKSETKITKNGYNVFFSIPLDKIGYDKQKGLTYNCFRIEKEGDPETYVLLSKNATLCNYFHRPGFFTKF